MLGRTIDKLDDLIYRARAFERGTSLRIVSPGDVGCPTADVEVDVDMESYEDATYLWGAHVSVNHQRRASPKVTLPSSNGTSLNHESEASIFQDFWNWLSELRAICEEQGRTFAAYCFWAQAEDGAMNRAVDPPVARRSRVSTI